MDERTTLTIPQEFRRAGYDHEEEYFYRENKRAIEALRRRRAAEMRRERRQEAEARAAAPRESGIRSALRRIADLIFRPRRVGIEQFPV